MATIIKRVSNTGDISYQVKVRLKGYPQQTATFERKTDAQKWAQATEAAIREGRHFKTSAAKKHLLAEVIERYERDILPHKGRKKSDRKSQNIHLTWWKKELGSYSLADVTPSLIAEKRDMLLNGTTKRKKLRSPSTVVRYMATLSHALTIAVKEWGWLDDSPMRKVTKPKEPRGRVRFLSDDERKQLLIACKESRASLLYPIVAVALSTGMRLGEILALTWADVDTVNGKIVIHETKNGERRAVPLTGHALEEIRKLIVPDNDTGLLFPSKRGVMPVTIRRAWDTAVKRANVTNFRFHDLRHSAASYLAMNGASLAEIAEVMGHKTLQMVKRYAHLSEAHTNKVVASMNAKIFG